MRTRRHFADLGVNVAKGKSCSMSSVNDDGDESIDLNPSLVAALLLREATAPTGAGRKSSEFSMTDTSHRP